MSLPSVSHLIRSIHCQGSCFRFRETYNLYCRIYFYRWNKLSFLEQVLINISSFNLLLSCATSYKLYSSLNDNTVLYLNSFQVMQSKMTDNATASVSAKTRTVVGIAFQHASPIAALSALPAGSARQQRKLVVEDTALPQSCLAFPV